ncbi:MAG: helix-turn-helix domain-containing protein, partial [Nanoarchaeota archaeon]
MTKQRLQPGEFSKVFGPTPRNKIMECFLELRSLDNSAGDIAKETGLNRATTYNNIALLEKDGYLTKTRKVSGSQLYKLDEKKPEVKILIKVFNMMLTDVAKRYE